MYGVLLVLGENKVIIMDIVSPPRFVSDSSLAYFSSVGASSKIYYYSLPISPVSCHIKE